MNDHYTGFVRFGFRDYDPRFGRFTAKDPIGDTGGDHDLWEYCVDDPVGMHDPGGLEGEAVDDDHGWFRKSIGWWTLPNRHPAYQRGRPGFLRSMKKGVSEAAGGLMDLTNMYTRLPLAPVEPYATPWLGDIGPSDEDRARAKKRFQK